MSTIHAPKAKQARLFGRVWSLIQEPRSVTLIIALGLYLPAFAMGVRWLFEGDPDVTSRDWAAILLLVGGLLGIIGVLPGEWGLERVGLFGMIAGWVTHLAVTASTPNLIDVWDESAIVSLLGALLVRVLRTWGIPRDPRSKRFAQP